MAARVEARQAEWAQRAAEIAHEAVPAHPSITNHAASLERHGEVGSRLHQYAAVYEQRRELLRTQQLLEEMAPFEPGWAPFEPYGEGGAEETMDERAQRSAARREERLKKATPQYPFTPALNARSLAMETRREPGAPPATPSVASTSRASEPAADPECSFTPRLNPNSARIDRARRAPTGVARIDQMARRQELQRAKARRLREERESHELDGCTFRPEIRRAGGGGGGEARRPRAARSPSGATRGSSAARSGCGASGRRAGARARRVHVPAGGGGRRRRRGGGGGGGGGGDGGAGARDGRVGGAAGARARAAASEGGAGVRRRIALDGRADDAEGVPIGRAAADHPRAATPAGGGRRAVAARPPSRSRRRAPVDGARAAARLRLFWLEGRAVDSRAYVTRIY